MKRRRKEVGPIVARITLLAGLLLWSLAPVDGTAQHSTGHEEESAGHHGHEHHHHVEMEASPMSDQSVYQLHRTWLSHREESIKLSQFLGKPVIVVMFYGSCTDVCPILIQDAWRLYRSVDPDVREQVQVLAVTFDTERDTPELLADYARRERLDLPNWHFLSASDQAVRELAMVLGVEYRKRTDGMYDHTNMVAVLDSRGEVAQRVVGLGREMDDASQLIDQMVTEEGRQ